ncbi:hypothetical protein [Streptomyces sp. NPDC048196]|uniref:hypothetical protein n=1 Tax=Streptomyces sp. NPDC048196 TaxID=3154712 RepID=UPI0033CA8755
MAAAPGRRGALTAAMCLCVSLVVGMVSAVNLALPDLSASALHPSAQAVVRVVDGHVVVFAGLLVPAGALADRWGRKGTLLCGPVAPAAGTARGSPAPGPVL